MKLSDFYTLDQLDSKLANSKAVLSALTKLVRSIDTSDSDLVLFNYLQSALLVDGQQMKADTTLETLLASVNSLAKQENVNLANVKNIAMGQDGLLTLGSFGLPLWQTKVNSVIDSQNRHRLVAIGTICYSLVKMYPMVVQPCTSEKIMEFKNKVLAQKLAVLTLSYQLPTLPLVDGEKTLKTLEVNATLFFNGSRNVQASEKTSVKLSMNGVDTSSPLSLFNALNAKKIKPIECFTFLFLHAHYDNEGQQHIGYYERIATGKVKLNTPVMKAYKSFMPSIISDFAKLLFAELVVQCPNMVYANGSESFPLGDKNEAKAVPFKGKANLKVMQSNLLWLSEKRTIQQWQDLGIAEYCKKDKESYTLIELCFQSLMETTSEKNCAVKMKRHKEGAISMGTILFEFVTALKAANSFPIVDNDSDDNETLDTIEPLQPTELNDIDWDAI